MWPHRTHANLELLNRFFDQHPQWAAEGKCFLSFKGADIATDGAFKGVDGSEAGLRKSVDSINEKLGGKKKMDLYQVSCAKCTCSFS